MRGRLSRREWGRRWVPGGHRKSEAAVHRRTHRNPPEEPRFRFAIQPQEMSRPLHKAHHPTFIRPSGLEMCARDEACPLAAWPGCVTHNRVAGRARAVASTTEHRCAKAKTFELSGSCKPVRVSLACREAISFNSSRMRANRARTRSSVYSKRRPPLRWAPPQARNPDILTLGITSFAEPHAECVYTVR